MNIGHNSQQAMITALPASMQDIADTMGLGMVFALVEHFGGVELRIPHRLHPDHKLMVLGQTQAETLCRYCATDTINVPVSLDRNKLKRQVDHLEGLGMERWKIARELGITQRHVRRLANAEPKPETPKDDRQPGLFD